MISDKLLKVTLIFLDWLYDEFKAVEGIYAAERGVFYKNNEHYRSAMEALVTKILETVRELYELIDAYRDR